MDGLQRLALDTLEVIRVEDGFSEWSEAIGLGRPVQVLTARGPAPEFDPAVLVLDASALAVRALDTVGDEVLTFCGGGEGPGEFRRFGRVQADSSGIWVFDAGSSRLTSWSWEGELLAERVVRNPQRVVGSFAVVDETVVVPAAWHDDRLYFLADSLDGREGLPEMDREDRGEAPFSMDHVASAEGSLFALETGTGRFFFPARDGAGYSVEGFRLTEEVTRPLDEILERIREDLGPTGTIETQYVGELHMLSGTRALLTFQQSLPGAIVGADLDLASETMTLIRLRLDAEVVDEEYVRRVLSVTRLGDCYLVTSPMGVARHCPSEG